MKGKRLKSYDFKRFPHVLPRPGGAGLRINPPATAIGDRSDWLAAAIGDRSDWPPQ